MIDPPSNRNSGHEEPPETEPSGEGLETERGKERQKEEEEFVPVILKRTDEALRHPDDILEKAIDEGLEQLQRPFFSLLLSACAAGLILSFSAMSVAILEGKAALLAYGPLSARLAAALVYPLGFVLCIMSGSQLFTEHTATAVYPILDRREKVPKLLRLWVTVIVGNLSGALVGAALLMAADGVIQGRSGYLAIGRQLVGIDAGSLIVSALLAGWLMALGAWLVLATPPTLSQMVSIYIVTFVIGLGGLHHSIAGSVEIFTAYLFSDHLTLAQVGRFIGLAIFGNLIGGSIFVALLNYGHIRQTQKTSES